MDKKIAEATHESDNGDSQEMPLHDPNRIREPEDDPKNACMIPAEAVPAPVAVAAPASANAYAPVAASEQDGAFCYQCSGGIIVPLNLHGRPLNEPKKAEVSESQQMESDETRKLNEEVKRLKEDNGQLHGQLTDQISENAKLKIKFGKAELEISSLNGRVHQLTEALKANHDTISDLETCKKENKEKILELQKNDKKSTEELEKRKKDVEQKEELLALYEEQFNDLTIKIKEYEHVVDSYKRQIKEKDRHLDNTDELMSLLQAAPTSSLLPVLSKDAEERLGRQRSGLIVAAESLEGEISSLQDRPVSGEHFVPPDPDDRVLGEPEKVEVCESQQRQDVGQASQEETKQQKLNGGDGLARSGENKVEKKMDERSEESECSGQDTCSTAQSSPLKSEQSVKTTLYITIVYKDLKKKTGERRKPCRKETLNKLIKFIHALLNTAGGVIRIDESQNDKTTIIKDRGEFIQSLEQLLVLHMEQSEYKKCISYPPVSEQDYKIDVKRGTRTYTLNSGLKIPLSRSVADASHPLIVNIYDSLLEGVDRSVDNYPDQSLAELYFDSKVPFEEGDTIQFKLINKGKATFEQLDECFAKHLLNYVSAFANYRGGSIYFGIDDDGTVKGQVMGDGLRTATKNRINEINKTGIWGRPGFVPKDGEHWTIEFLKVVDGPVTEERSVVKVKIPPFNGGMFLKRPLAFKIDETSGEVVEMTFDEWRNIYISVASCLAGNRATERT